MHKIPSKEKDLIFSEISSENQDINYIIDKISELKTRINNNSPNILLENSTNHNKTEKNNKKSKNQKKNQKKSKIEIKIEIKPENKNHKKINNNNNSLKKNNNEIFNNFKNNINNNIRNNFNKNQEINFKKFVWFFKKFLYENFPREKIFQINNYIDTLFDNEETNSIVEYIRFRDNFKEYDKDTLSTALFYYSTLCQIINTNKIKKENKKDIINLIDNNDSISENSSNESSYNKEEILNMINNDEKVQKIIEYVANSDFTQLKTIISKESGKLIDEALSNKIKKEISGILYETKYFQFYFIYNPNEKRLKLCRKIFDN